MIYFSESDSLKEWHSEEGLKLETSVSESYYGSQLPLFCWWLELKRGEILLQNTCSVIYGILFYLLSNSYDITCASEQLGNRSQKTRASG